jgi:chemotaxis response regulator CheB
MAKRKRQCSKNITQKTKYLATRSPQWNKVKTKTKNTTENRKKHKKTKKHKTLVTIGAPEG